MSTDTTTSDLDVVIPSKDRPDLLTATLAALNRQSVKRFGVIVVDDGSATEAEQLVPETLRRALSIRFVRNETSLGAGPTRNRGVAVSKADYIVFLDDDCVAAPELIERHRAALSSAGGPVVSLGPILSPRGVRLPVWTHWDADRLERGYASLGRGQTQPGWADLFTGNVGVRRADFLAVGGFDERFPRGEDTELGHRLDEFGCRFMFDSEAVVWHHSERSLRSWLRIAADTARFDVEWNRLAPGSDRMSLVTTQSRDKHWAIRLARKVARGPVMQDCVIGCAMGAGFLLHALRIDRAALPAFSLVRDLVYWQALQEAKSSAAKSKAAA